MGVPSQHVDFSELTLDLWLIIAAYQNRKRAYRKAVGEIMMYVLLTNCQSKKLEHMKG